MYIYIHICILYIYIGARFICFTNTKVQIMTQGTVSGVCDHQIRQEVVDIHINMHKYIYGAPTYELMGYAGGSPNYDL